MRLWAFTLIVLIAVSRGALCTAQPTGPSSDGLEDLVARLEPTAVVIFAVRNGDPEAVQASGCVVDPSGIVLTTAHFLVGAESYRGALSDGTRFALTPRIVDEERDLALFQADRALPAHAVPGDSDALRKGATLIALTTPRSLLFSVATGIVSSTERTYRGRPVLQTTLPLAEGSSGGPVFNQDGALVGLVFGRIEGPGDSTLVYPVSHAYPLLARIGVVRPAEEPAASGPVPEAAATPQRQRAVDAFNRGVASAGLERKLAAYEEAVREDPQFFEASFNLAHTLAALGRKEEAIAAYQRARELRPDSPAVLRNMGRLYMQTARTDDMLRCFEAAVALAPENPSALNDLGEGYRRAGRLPEAISRFEQALRVDPAHANARYNLGLAQWQANNLAAAEQAFETYLQQHSDALDAAQVGDWLRQLRTPSRGAPSVGGR